MNPAPTLATCGYDGCDTPTQEYLCHTCVEELTHDWKNIPDLLPVLHNIVSGKDVPFHTPTAEQRGGPTGSRPPINLTALQLAADLEYAHSITPQQWAQDRHGPKYKQRIHRWVTNANRLVYGEPENADSKANIAKYRINTAEPKTSKELVVIFRRMGITIKPTNISTWADRGLIQRRNTQGHPTYDPKQVYDVYRQSRLARKKVNTR